ncbi:MAG: cytochrome c3 family protein, partial [Nitrospirota bacterium]|nr:cytochrome c3 family protein [Nitrospirota bacterium]
MTLLTSAIALLAFSGIGSAQMALKSNLSEVCLQCHDSLKAKLSEKFTHFPFKQGKCISCHNSHAASRKGLMNETVNELCNGCHQNIKKLLSSASVHGALRSGACTDCHDPHASTRKGLLKKDEKDLCWSCHSEARKGLDSPRVHHPLKEGSCSVCHNPHASAEDALLISDPTKLCKSCHQPQCKAGGVLITNFTKDKKCTSCHSGHSGASKGLLGPHAHKDFLNRNCEACHTPIVSGKSPALKQTGKELCLNCHKTVGARAGDPHLVDRKGGVCSTCHDSHASRSPKLLTGTKTLCSSCHGIIYKKISAMERIFPLRCVPVRDRDCFACHVPPHAAGPLYFKVADTIALCSSCHTAQH